MNYLGSIFAMVVCIAMSAYFSATETAFSSLNKTRLKVLADNGNKRAALALKLSEDYDKLISTILIGNNIVNIMVASIGTLLFVGLYGDIGATVSTLSSLTRELSGTHELPLPSPGTNASTLSSPYVIGTRRNAFLITRSPFR